MWNEVSDIVFVPFKNVGIKIVEILPQCVGALVLLLIGAVVGKLLRKLAEKVLVIGKLDTISEKIGISDFSRRAKINQHQLSVRT